MPTRYQRFSFIAAAICLLLAILPSATLPVGAQQQNEIILSVEFDGAQPNGDVPPFDTATDGTHTPGQDHNNANNVVLTHDTIGYRIDWNVNEVDGTATTITASLPEGMSWQDDPGTLTGVPSGCTDDGTSSNTGNSGRDLVCVTDDEHEGSNGAIHPIAYVGSQFDGQAMTLTASIGTDQLPPVVSNPVTTYASARPRADWIKGDDVLDNSSTPPIVISQKPEAEFLNITNPDTGEVGRIWMYPLRLVPVGGLIGSERLDDTIPIDMYDHAYQMPAGAILADNMVPATPNGTARTACGAYDGVFAYPVNTVGTWTCTDVTATAGTGYPVIHIQITGQDTLNMPPTNGDYTNNTKHLMAGQIAFWVPESSFVSFPVDIFNGVSGTTDAVTVPSDLDPIQIWGSAPTSFDEAGVDNNYAGYSAKAVPPPAGPGRSFRHMVKYQSGPYQEVLWEAPNGFEYRSVDTRLISRGGLGPMVNYNTGTSEYDQGWGLGYAGPLVALTPRGNQLVITAEMDHVQSAPTDPYYYEPSSLCVAIDPTHQSIMALPATFDVNVADPASRVDRIVAVESVATQAGSPNTGPLAQVHIGSHPSYPYRVFSYGHLVETTQVDIPYVVEFAAGNVAPSNFSTINGVTCNNDDVDDRGWVDSAGNLDVFDSDTAAVGYEDITHVRLRVTGPMKWRGTSLHQAPGGAESWGTSINLNLQVRVKDDPLSHQADQELFVYSSRAYTPTDVYEDPAGAVIWDPATMANPGTPTCTHTTNSLGLFNNHDVDNDGVGDGIDYNNAPNIPGGWCNLPYTDDGLSSTHLGDDPNDFGGGGADAYEMCTNADYMTTGCYPRAVHADKVKIVEAQLAIGKSNLAGPADYNQNGDIIEFEVRPSIVGSSLDTLSDVMVTDVLPAQYEFVGFTQDPATTTNTNATTPPNNDGTALTLPLCSVAGQTITCDFGTQVGGWSDSFRYEVRLRDAGVNKTLTNTATIMGNDALTGVERKRCGTRRDTGDVPAADDDGNLLDSDGDGELYEENCVWPKATAKSFTAGPFQESGIIKFIDPHLGPCTLADDCSFIAPDGNIRFTLDVNNEGPTDLANYRVIDVLPHLGDEVEMASLTLTGDGRTPESLFSGSVDLIAASAAGATVYYTGDNPNMISRDPDMSETVNTWCQTLGGAPDIGAGTCPADLAAVTGVYLDLGTLLKGETRTITLDLATIDNECGDVYTNNFGGRTDDILLPVRSNDVTATVGFCETGIDIEKDTNGVQADNDPAVPAGTNVGPGVPVGDTVTWTYVVENTGDVAIINALVSDSDPAVTPDCDIDGDGTFDGTDTIPLMLPDATVTCQATGTSVGGQYTNDSSVSGTPVLPDFNDPDLDPAVDPTDPSTWPTDAAAYVAPVDPVTGDPALPSEIDDADPSAYWGIPSDVGVDIEKDTNGDQADDTAGPIIPVGGDVTWTYVVENTGQLPIAPATVADSDPALTVVCEASLADAGGDNIIDVFLPGESITCTATGTASGGAYENTATVSGPTALPTADCVCDPADPATWPTSADDYTPFIDEATGEPVTVEDSDDSHYTGVGYEPGIDIEKATNGLDSDTAPGAEIPVGDVVTWTYVVENSGNTAISDATVTDDQGVTVSCDIDGNGSMDGTNVIPFMLPGDKVTCEGTGTAVGGPYMNNASVSGDPIVPDATLCGCDPDDPSSWPTDESVYGPMLGADGNPAAALTDEDPSHYTGTQILSGVVWDDTDKDGIQDPGEKTHAGVVVELLDENGDPVLDANGNPITTITDVNGYYEFNVPPGKYRLRFTPPAGTSITGGSGSDNDADPSSKTTGVIEVVAGVNVPGIDAGLVPSTPGTLAFTGSESGRSVSIALALMAVGLAMVGLVRRRSVTS